MILRSLSLVDIDGDPKPLYDLPVSVPQGFCATQMPTINPVYSSDPMFVDVGTPGRKSLLEFFDDVISFFRVSGFNPSPALDLIQGHSKVVTGLLVDERILSIRCHRIQARRNRVHHSVHLLLRLLEGKLCSLLASRIEHDSVKRYRLSGVVAVRGNAGVKPLVLPVSAHEAMDGVIPKAFGEHSIPVVCSFLKIIWVD